MLKETREVLDWKVDMLVYESVEEADQDAGVAGAGLKEMNNNLLYRGTYQKARTIIYDVVAKATGVAPLTRPTGDKDAKGNDILEAYENDSVFVDRALATSGKTVAELQSAVTEACNAANDGKGLAADIKAKVRTGVGPKVPVQDTLQATAFIRGDINKATGKAYDLSKFEAAFAKVVGHPLVVVGETEEEKIKSLAAQCTEFRKAANVFNKM